MINLAPAFIAIGILQKPAVLESPGGGYVEGEWRSDPIALDIQVAIQSSSQADLVQYADGDRLDGYVTIWTRAELHTVDEDSDLPAQKIITPEGKTYRIVKAGRRNEAGFTRAIGRLDSDRGRSV